MTKIERTLVILAATLALLGGVFGYGYHKGTVNQIEKSEKARVQLQTDLLDLGTELSLKNKEILRLNQEKEGLIYELENQAMDAVGADNPGISATGGLQRLEQRWGPSPGTSN